jgi:hypothetical protein
MICCQTPRSFRPRLLVLRCERGWRWLVDALPALGMAAILAVMLFPVLLRPRADTNQALCLNNLRQLALAVKMYQNDWGGYYPTVREVYMPDEGADYRTEWFFENGKRSGDPAGTAGHNAA